MPGFIEERLFSSFDNKNSGYISQEDFTNGLLHLFTGNFEFMCRTIYNIYDYNKDNKISKEDISVVLSYIPLKTINEVNNSRKLKYEK